MTNNINYEEIIEQDILEILGAKNMSQEQKRNLYTKMLETIQRRTMIRIHDQLSEADREEWKKILDSGDGKKAGKYLLDHGIEVPKLLAEEALILKTELADLAKE